MYNLQSIIIGDIKILTTNLSININYYKKVTSLQGIVRVYHIPVLENLREYNIRESLITLVKTLYFFPVHGRLYCSMIILFCAPLVALSTNFFPGSKLQDAAPKVVECFKITFPCRNCTCDFGVEPEAHKMGHSICVTHFVKLFGGFMRWQPFFIRLL